MLVLYGHNPEDIRTWDQLVDRAPVPDVYYRPAYVRAYGLSGHGRPLALVIRSGSTEALFPLLVRQFGLNNEIVRDAVTPYGYGGVLNLSGPEFIEPQVVQDLLCLVREWARASGLAACTLRLHPLLGQERLWVCPEKGEEWIRVFPRGQTTAIQLAHWDPIRQTVSGMSQGRWYDLKKARSHLSFRLSEGTDAVKDIVLFQSLYTERMKRVQADEFFLFSDTYFEHLAEELGDRFVMITAIADDRPVGSAIFLADREFAHYHLAASNDEGRRCGAATLLVIAAAEWAQKRGCSVFHLGGGVRNDDSLWAFKRSFGGAGHWYSYTTLVVDREQYDFSMCHGELWPYASAARVTTDAALPTKAPRGRPLRIGYFADGPWAHRALDLLRGRKHFETAFIVARHDRPDLVLQDYASEMEIPFLVHRDVNSEEFLQWIGAYGCDLHVSMSFDQILKAPILASAPEGFINCHAGALPFYKGRNILNWAIINGESRFGVTVHYIDVGIDTGAIILQRFAAIGETDDYGTILPNAIELCAQCLVDALEMIYSGTVATTSQSKIHPVGFYCSPRRDGDEWIDWEWPTNQIHNFIRGISPPSPGARTIANGNTVAILESKLIKGAPNYIGVAGEVVGRGPDGNIVKTGDSTLLITKIANVGEDGTLERIRVPKFAISTRMGPNLRTLVGELEQRVEELTQMLQQLARIEAK